MSKNRVWVLGSSNIDFTYNVERLPLKGQTVTASSYNVGTGGKGANQAIAAAHFGSNVSFIGAVGNDPEGQILLDTLKKWQIDVEHVIMLDGIKSGNAVIFVDSDGNNFISVFPGANQHVPLSLIENITFNQGDYLIAQLEVNLDIIERSFLTAKRNNAITVLNVSPYKKLSNALIQNTDIILLNETEALEMTNVSVSDAVTAKESALRLIKNGIPSVIITLGGLGVVLSNTEKSIYFPGHKVKVVDTQGAGDAFLGTLISKLGEGRGIEESVSVANYIASISVTKMGSTQICLPDLNNIDLNYNKHYSVL